MPQNSDQMLNKTGVNKLIIQRDWESHRHVPELFHEKLDLPYFKYVRYNTVITPE